MGKRLEKVLLAVLAIFSLGTASVPACACNHHLQTSCHRPSCYDDTEMSEMADSKTATTGDDLSLGSECICMITADRGIVKSESVKLKKMVSAVTVAAQTVTSRNVSFTDEPRLVFEKPSYLTNSFYDLAPNRGPPIL